MTEEFIERGMIIGLIVSTEYIQKIYNIWNPRLLESPTAKILAGWCMEYFNIYKQAPRRDIEGIYTHKLKNNKLSKNKAEWIEDVLGSLNEEYKRTKFNVDYLIDQTKNYLREDRKRHV